MDFVEIDKTYNIKQISTKTFMNNRRPLIWLFGKEGGVLISFGFED